MSSRNSNPLSVYRKLSEEELSGKILTKTVNYLTGPGTKTYIKCQEGMISNEYIIDPSHDMREASYTLDFEKAEYSRGSMYNYSVDLPKVGLIVTSKCNGYGSGHSMSYFIYKVISKKKRIMEFECCPIYWYTPEKCYFNALRRATFVQSGSKNGDWKPKGATLPLTSYVVFGHIALPDNGFDK